MSLTFPVSSSVISAQHLAAFIESAYMPGVMPVCRILKSGINDTYSVTAPDGRFVFRIYSLNWRTKQEIQEEMKLLEHLHTNGLPVSYALGDTTGNYIQEINAPEGMRYGVLFSYAEGRKLQTSDADTHHNLGVVMAKLHKVTEGMKLDRPTYTAEELLERPMKELADFLRADSKEMDFMKMLQKQLQATLTDADKLGLRQGVVHMDIWFDNINVTPDNKISIFDFDFCGNGWLCLDIAYYILQLHSVERDLAICQGKVNSFLAGYESVLAISAEERRLLPALGLCMYFFYLGVQCRRYDNWSSMFLNDAYLYGFINNLIKRYYDIHKER